MAKVNGSAEHTNSPWARVEPGSVILIDGKRFRLSTLEPTREGSSLAWLTGLYVTNGGKPARGYLSHLHCPEGQREELVDITRVRVYV